MDLNEKLSCANSTLAARLPPSPRIRTCVDGTGGADVAPAKETVPVKNSVELFKTSAVANWAKKPPAVAPAGVGRMLNRKPSGAVKTS